MASREPVHNDRSLRDPIRVADIVLAAAVRSQSDAVYIEPDMLRADSYSISMERNSSTIATISVDAGLGSAVIARLAFLADLDLAAAHATSGRVPIRSGTRDADVMITVRPGGDLRADLMVVRRERRTVHVGLPVGPMPGDTIGQYRITEFLGEGGMGTVFRAEHVALQRTYAFKVLRTRVIERDPTSAQRFLREARTAARVRHPNIVDVVDFGYLADGRPYFVMELLEGESLADRIARGALPATEVVAIARQLVAALGAAHDRGVIHADVTPSNVLLLKAAGDEPRVKLVDFGLAELVGEGVRDESPEFVLGTPAYISPEQLRGLAPTDRSDQYGLGAVMFEMISGQPPYFDPDLRTLCMMHVSAPIPPVESPHGPLPPRLAELVTQCLQKTPNLRFPNMHVMGAVLDEIANVSERRGWRKWLSS